MAENSLAKGHKRSTCEAYLRAALIHHPESEDPGVVHAGRQRVSHCQTGTLSVTSQRVFDWLDEII
jgi:hypothetical protein